MRFERELLKGVAPLAVLEILSRGSAYGYELSETLAKRSGNILTLGRGTLYPLLYNLEAKGVVESDVRVAESGRQRRYYTITNKGKKQLARHRQQWEKLQEGMNRVFGTSADEAAAHCS
jgi:PadR family transcriptional regulator PadR